LSSFSQETTHLGEEVSEFSVWAMSHMGRASSSVSFDLASPPEAYSDPTVYTKVQEYTSKVREIHGEDYDVRIEPIDVEAIMMLRGGKKHRRLWITDGVIDSTTALSRCYPSTKHELQPAHTPMA
jgi:hypothetical protein